MKGKAIIQINNIEKHFISASGHITFALKGISLSIYDGEFFVIVGPSGSGKSTLLRLISRLENANVGNITYNEDAAKIGFVFQNNSVFPWFDVQRNIGFAMEINKIPEDIRLTRAKELAALVGLGSEFLTKYPKELSGGERRRVAIAMALAHDAKILLLDEPTSSLDDLNKWHFQDIIQNLWLEKGITCIMVTHDIEEAIFLGDRIAVLNSGSIKEIVNIDLSRPRGHELRGTSQFQVIRNTIRDLL